MMLHLNWKLLMQLFGSEESVALLNRFAPGLFVEIDTVMVQSIALGLVKLADPSKVKSNPKHESLGLPRLVEVVEIDQPGLPDRLNLRKFLDDLRNKCEPLREIRNRQLAHDDWVRRADPLPGVEVRRFEESFDLVRQIVNAVENHYTGSTTAYKNPPYNGDGKDLIDVLRDYAKWLDAGSEG
jgi:hypothetical protein